MLSFLKRTKPAFVIDYPQISIIPDTQTVIASLKASDIEYTLVTNDYITFEGKT